MNFFAIISFLLTGCIFFFSVVTATPNPEKLVDWHGILIVFGGTGAVTAISFELTNLWAMTKNFINRMIRGKPFEYRDIIEELMTIAQAYRTSESEARALVDKSKDPFIREAMTLLMDEVFEKDELFDVLKTRAEMVFKRYKADADQFKAVGKFPPAMGLMGAVLGMIALLGSLGEPDAQSNLGPAMSVALIATFYGIALANLIIIPIGENLGENSKRVYLKNSMVAEGVRLIADKRNPIVVAERMNSFLLHKERIDWKNLKAA